MKTEKKYAMKPDAHKAFRAFEKKARTLEGGREDAEKVRAHIVDVFEKQGGTEQIEKSMLSGMFVEALGAERVAEIEAVVLEESILVVPEAVEVINSLGLPFGFFTRAFVAAKERLEIPKSEPLPLPLALEEVFFQKPLQPKVFLTQQKGKLTGDDYMNAYAEKALEKLAIEGAKPEGERDFSKVQLTQEEVTPIAEEVYAKIGEQIKAEREAQKAERKESLGLQNDGPEAVCGHCKKTFQPTSVLRFDKNGQPVLFERGPKAGEQKRWGLWYVKYGTGTLGAVHNGPCKESLKAARAAKGQDLFTTTHEQAEYELSRFTGDQTEANEIGTAPARKFERKGKPTWRGTPGAGPRPASRGLVKVNVPDEFRPGEGKK